MKGCGWGAWSCLLRLQFPRPAVQVVPHAGVQTTAPLTNMRGVVSLRV
jgi:hypothetical protein